MSGRRRRYRVGRRGNPLPDDVADNMGGWVWFSPWEGYVFRKELATIAAAFPDDYDRFRLPSVQGYTNWKNRLPRLRLPSVQGYTNWKNGLAGVTEAPKQVSAETKEGGKPYGEEDGNRSD